MLKMTCAACALTLLSAPAWAAPAVTTFDPLGSVETFPSEINSSGTIAGAFADSSNRIHGFVRTADGMITVIDVPKSVANGNVTGTTADSINDLGAIAGTYKSANRLHGFIRAPDGTITIFGAAVPISSALINNSGRVAGVSQTLRKNHKRDIDLGYFRTINGKIVTYSVGVYTTPCCFNNRGQTIGLGTDTNGNSIGFVRTANGVVTTFYAGPMDGRFEPGTEPTAINDVGAVVGLGYDNTSHGVGSFAWLRAPDGTVTRFSVPGQANTTPRGINKAGWITGEIADKSGNTQGFVRTSAGAVTTFAVPGAVLTQPFSVNASGAIAGYYTDSSRISHGFIRSAP